MLGFVLVCINVCPFWFYSHIDEKERNCCFASIVFCMSYYCKCPVGLPRDAVVGLQFVIVVFPDHTHLVFVRYN